jgi:hypothetical protein
MTIIIMIAGTRAIDFASGTTIPLITGRPLASHTFVMIPGITTVGTTTHGFAGHRLSSIQFTTIRTGIHTIHTIIPTTGTVIIMATVDQ